MGRKQNRTKPSTSTPPPSTVNRTSSPTPPPSDDTTAADRALDILRRGSHAKALKIIKEQLSKNKNSPVLHRVNGEIHFQLANVIVDSKAKLKHLNNAAESAQRAVTLSPNSLSYSHFYVLTLIELCKESKEYDKVIQECDRALSVQNPIDPLNDGLREECELRKGLTKSRIDELRKDIRKYKNIMSVVKILDDDREEERVKFRANVEDRSEGDGEFKEMIRKKEKKIIELEKKIGEVKILLRKFDLEKRSVVNVRKVERMRKYWNERMSDESKKRLLRVRIDELEKYFDKNDAAREVLNEAIGYAKEKGTWKFSECHSCGRKFDDFETAIEHYVEEHVGVFPEELKKVFPGGVDKKWIDMIVDGDWRPVDTVAAVKIIENKDEDDIQEWPLSDDIERKTILENIRYKFHLLLGYKCLTVSVLTRVIHYARKKLRGLIPVLKFELDKKLHCLCFLGASELNDADRFLQEVLNLCSIKKADELIDDGHVLEIIERIVFSSDFKCLLLDDRLLRGGLIRDMYENSDMDVDADCAVTSVVDVVDSEMTPISDDIIDWLFMYFPIEEQLATWTQLKGDQLGETEVFDFFDTQFLNLQTMCERKLDLCACNGILTEVESKCHKEDENMNQNPESESQSYVSLLRKWKQELSCCSVERDDDRTQSHFDAIRDILEEALSLSFEFEECGKDDDWMMQDLLDQANYYIQEAIRKLKAHLFDELAKIDAMIMSHYASLIKIRVKLLRICVYDYRSIMLPLLKLFIQAHLEELVDKDVS